ncbi:MAG: ankyrin repeat domain-containing protein [Epsilonproteobacteria bacterium]|nr:ankyrin repeat domain-containing protein [Campylobacterota bacterium]
MKALHKSVVAGLMLTSMLVYGQQAVDLEQASTIYYQQQEKKETQKSDLLSESQKILTELFQELLSAVFTQINMTPLHLACASVGDCEQNFCFFQEALREADDVNLQTVCGLTPLHFIVCSFSERTGTDYTLYVKAIEKLVDRGANVNEQDCLGFTPLHYAALHGSFNEVEKLIECGADVNAISFQGITPLHLAAMKKKACVECMYHEDLQQFFDQRLFDFIVFDEGSGGWHLVVAASPYTNSLSPEHTDHLQVVNDLCAVNVQADVCDENGFKALDYAQQYGNFGIVSLLKEYERKQKINLLSADSEESLYADSFDSLYADSFDLLDS